MDRENFYLLLKLSIDPPENDPEVIEKAIKKQQTVWSRFRNHPTKAIQAQNNIDLIPEIRRVMLDQTFRENEAQELVKLIEKRDKAKFLKIDRHIRIYLSKGDVTGEEVERLAKLHSISPKKLLERVANLKELHSETAPPTHKAPTSKEEIFERIDKYLLIRIIRGFVSEKEICRLAKLYAIGEDEIRSRAKCPIIKNDSKKIEKPTPLDRSIVKVINDNLKVVARSTLYEFLDIPEDTPIEEIHTRSKEKRTTALRIGKKDALATASGVLAGHCIAIFKSRESRNAYNVSRALAHLEQLNSNIEVAQVDGVIIHSYFETLVEIFIEFGLDAISAQQYIEEFCKDKNWVIQSSKKIKRFLMLAAAVLFSTLIVIAVAAVSMRISHSRHIKKQFHNALSIAKNRQVLEEKEKVLKTFFDSLDKDSDLVSLIEKKIKEVRKDIKHRDMVDKQDYKITLESADKLIKAGKHKDAQAVYVQYMNMHPEGLYIEQSHKKIAEIDGLIDKRAFESLKNIPGSQSDKKVLAYKKYLKDYPNGKYRDDVQKMLLDISDDYYRFTKKQIALHEKNHQWDKCFKLCEDFLNTYKYHKKASEIIGLGLYFRKQMNKK
jgi:hypothetical protein